MRGDLELLNPYRAVGPAILLHVRLGRKTLHPVPHSTLDKPKQEVLLMEVEQAIVVRLIGALHRVMNPDRVVAEPLPHALAGTHRHQVDGEAFRRGWGKGGKRGSLCLKRARVERAE